MDPFYQVLLDSAFRYVSFRPRSEKELRDLLLQKLKKRNSKDTSSIDKVIDRIREYGHIDDLRFVRWWIEQRAAFKPKGVRVLRQELLQKGVARSIIDECLVGRSELEGARKILDKKIVRLQKLPLIIQKKKIFEYLGRRGFSSSIVAHVIDEYIGKDYNSQDIY